MLNYLIRRTAVGLVTLLSITFVVFGLIRNMPGTPLTYTLGETDPSRKINPEDIERMKRAYGLDKPWPVAYVQWLGNLARLDLGQSLYEKQPVTRVIAARIGPTLLLSSTSLILTYLLAVPLGLYATVRSGRLDERSVSTVLYMLYSLPSFVAALLLLIYFSLRMQGTIVELPLSGMVSDHHAQMSFFGKIGDVLWHMILPTICMTYGSLAYFSRFVKSNMQEVIRQDYIRTARAKGVAPFRVIVVHAFRNTLIPFVTLVGLTLPALLSGSVILEMIFTWPGMGLLFFDSITRRDYPTIMGLTLMFSLLTLAGQLLADVLYAVVDPRVTYS
jgi:peptide/nickel transport system permease protein